MVIPGGIGGHIPHVVQLGAQASGIDLIVQLPGHRLGLVDEIDEHLLGQKLQMGLLIFQHLPGRVVRQPQRHHARSQQNDHAPDQDQLDPVTEDADFFHSLAFRLRYSVGVMCSMRLKAL